MNLFQKVDLITEELVIAKSNLDFETNEKNIEYCKVLEGKLRKLLK